MGEKFKESLMLGLREAGIEIREKQLLQLEKYCAELVSWNEKINLTAIEEESEIAIKHFVDSVAFLPMVPYFNEGHWIDVGTGAGFPGLPLKIMGGCQN
jgi:16S rRNA (guanine527-N7)-methyltransferase